MIFAADDTISWFLGLLIGVGMIGAAIAIIVVTNGAASGRIGPNPGTGIRTAATRSSLEAWQAAHRAAMPIMQFAAVLGMATGAVLLFLRSSPSLFWGVLFVGVALLAAFSVWAAIVADRAAKRVRDSTS